MIVNRDPVIEVAYDFPTYGVWQAGLTGNIGVVNNRHVIVRVLGNEEFGIFGIPLLRSVCVQCSRHTLRENLFEKFKNYSTHTAGRQIEKTMHLSHLFVCAFLH